MSHRIREPFGKAGLIVAVVALVAALVGGAYAASGLTGKQKKEVKKIAKKFAGKPGPVGAQGPKGDAGSNGTNGTNGTGGTNGTNGASVTGAAATAAECGGVAGGVKYTLDGTTTKICNGKEGAAGESVDIVPLDPGDTVCKEGGTKFIAGSEDPGYACNGLSGTGSGGTMSGLWQNEGEEGITLGEFALTTISFPAELDNPPAEVILLDEATATEEEKTKCPGNGFEPKATAGVLCLYVINGEPELKVSLPQKFGAILYFDKTAGISFGSWAVAPAA